MSAFNADAFIAMGNDTCGNLIQIAQLVRAAAAARR